uniref:Putative transcriptional regulator n=1 Tax=uncultured marine group II/III euryarchaeote KM3_162_H08 TaxID=1457916 RepID=A0A075GNA1_9EURY|nr:putative transcriptional regulator [uncultured marine group II/III euryarchaeote KM3_162_H08]
MTLRCILYTKYRLYNLLRMARPPLRISASDLKRIEQAISEVEENGGMIRRSFESYYDDDFDVGWEVDAAVDAFSIFSSKWTIEILATLYIAGDRRFNEMRALLRGISSRTLSDKLTICVQNGLVDRVVEDGPPIRVIYRLTGHGREAGRLLSPLVAYMKLHQGHVVGPK